MINPTPVVDLNVARSFVQVYLRALRNYRSDAQDGLARTVQECAVSVEHAEATLRQFDHECPTPKEIKTAAWNIRDRYLPPDPPEEKWKAEGYVKDEKFSQKLAQEILAMDYKPGGPTKHELMWQAIKAHLHVQEFSRVPWGRIYQAQKELGFPLNAFEQEELARYLALPETKLLLVPPVAMPAIPPVEPQPEITRCAICDGTGRTEDGQYCNCSTGRDLARVERPVEKSDADEDWDGLPEAVN